MIGRTRNTELEGNNSEYLLGRVLPTNTHARTPLDTNRHAQKREQREAYVPMSPGGPPNGGMPGGGEKDPPGKGGGGMPGIPKGG